MIYGKHLACVCARAGAAPTYFLQRNTAKMETFRMKVNSRNFSIMLNEFKMRRKLFLVEPFRHVKR